MRHSRVYLDTPLTVGSEVVLPRDAARHIGLVLRRKPGQALHVFNGLGGYYLAKVVSVDKRSVVIEIAEFFDEECEPGLQITLAQGISRGQHMDYTVQKAVELGVRRIAPILTERSNVHLDEQRTGKRLEHWNKVVIAACEQCGRNDLPELIVPMTLSDWLVHERASLKLILDPTSAESLNGLSVSENNISLLSGPEGGFSEVEVAAAGKYGFQSIRLGPRVLRTETAAVAALAAIQTLWGDMA